MKTKSKKKTIILPQSTLSFCLFKNCTPFFFTAVRFHPSLKAKLTHQQWVQLEPRWQKTETVNKKEKTISAVQKQFCFEESDVEQK